MKELLPKIIKENKQIIFNGNNYSDEWRKEAAKRGPAEPHQHGRRAARARRSRTSCKIFEKYKVLNGRELHARYEIAVETYVKTVNVEAQLMVLMANRYILPAALQLPEGRRRVGQGGEGRRRLEQGGEEAARSAHRRSSTICARDRQAREGPRAPRRRRREAREVHARHDRAGMDTLRESGDQIELLVPHELWPLPTYREMLFIK